jgi:uncharacterized protein YkwD
MPWLRVPLAFLIIVMLACCGGTTAQPDLKNWPPEEPRQPGRLVLVAPDESDPLSWWRINLLEQLSPSIYDSPWQVQLTAELVEQTNLVREKYGLSPVTRMALLDRAAQAHARDQAIRDYWSHWTPEGLGSRDRILAAGLPTVAGGENSSITTLGGSDAGSIVRGWEQHAGHRELLLDPELTSMGAGVYNYSPGEFIFFVQLLVSVGEE